MQRVSMYTVMLTQIWQLRFRAIWPISTKLNFVVIVVRFVAVTDNNRIICKRQNHTTYHKYVESSFFDCTSKLKARFSKSMLFTVEQISNKIQTSAAETSFHFLVSN